MKLLVSVVDAAEALAALEGGADIIDVKNPLEGALGANFPWRIREIAGLMPGGRELSATLGDAACLPGAYSLAAAGAAWCGARYVKVGLYGMENGEAAIYFLRQVNRAIRLVTGEQGQVIAVGYADAGRVGAMPPAELPRVAAEAGVHGCMLDTAVKDGASLLRVMTMHELARFVRETRARRLVCGLAGSLGSEDLPAVRELGPDVVGVRSAACRGDRVRGRVDSELVSELRRALFVA
ncbi:hypothetical protein SY88_21025 [Clostridiales bacterium PH28_bin88]|nr:hypothetical protein SY88_21025 [Clostridiales bacterium PH28_bin88]